jgi:hypothetical protein
VKNPEHHDWLTSKGHMYCGICLRSLRDHERNVLMWLVRIVERRTKTTWPQWPLWVQRLLLRLS